MRVAVVVNREGGSVSDALERSRVADAFQKAGVDAHVRIVDGAGVEAAVRSALDDRVDAVVAGGGDGTISTTASVLAGTGVPFGVLPLGTANHFARDLHIPLDLEGAARCIARARVRELDVAEVNGRFFVNNALLGYYPEVVRLRERLRRKWHVHKYTATAVAGALVFPRMPVLRVQVETDAHAFVRTTPFVFVGNNAYVMRFFGFGARDRFQGGRLHLYVTPRSGRLAILRLLLKALVSDLKQDADFESYEVSTLRIDAPGDTIHVFVDGEIVTLRPPLRFRTHPRALRVIL